MSSRSATRASSDALSGISPPRSPLVCTRESFFCSRESFPSFSWTTVDGAPRGPRGGIRQEIPPLSYIPAALCCLLLVLVHVVSKPASSPCASVLCVFSPRTCSHSAQGILLLRLRIAPQLSRHSWTATLMIVTAVTPPVVGRHRSDVSAEPSPACSC